MGSHAMLVPLIRRQHRAFLVRQALDAGFSESSVRRKVASREWTRVHRRVLAAATAPRTPQFEASAAVLACGSGAVASHRTAACLWDLKVEAPELVEVTVPLTVRPRPRGIRVVRSGNLQPIEAVTIDNIPTTSPLRTVLDVGSSVPPSIQELCFDALWRRNLLTPERASHYLELARHANRPGSAALREIVRERRGRAAPGSDLETLYLACLRRYGVPIGIPQYPVETRSGRKRIDVAYPGEMIASELDGFSTRFANVERFEDDHARQNDIAGLGWSVRRFTWRQVTLDPLGTAVDTASAIGLEPSRWRRTRTSRPLVGRREAD